MSVVCGIDYFVLFSAFSAVTSITPAVSSDEFKPSTDFKNGLIVGQAVQANSSVVLCFELLARRGDDETDAKVTDRERLFEHLFLSAEMIHRAVVLPDSVLPKRMRASFEESLTMISDELHKSTPERMDVSKYLQGRAAYIEELREHMKDGEKRKIWIDSYDQQAETAKMLAKYRSAPKKGSKTNDDGKE